MLSAFIVRSLCGDCKLFHLFLFFKLTALLWWLVVLVISHKAPVAKEKKSQLTDAQRDRVNKVLSKLRGTESTRVYPKSFFADYDRRNNFAFTGLVTTQQFIGVLKNNLNVNVSMSDLDLLCECYMRDNMIDYVIFCRDLAPKAVVKAKPKPLLTRRNMARKVTTRSLADIMRKMRTKVLQSRINTASIFRDFDTLRSGRVTIPIFFRCLGLVNMLYTRPEMQLLLDQYCNSQNAMVDYVTFSRDLDKG